jgi:hypothetical protein
LANAGVASVSNGSAAVQVAETVLFAAAMAEGYQRTSKVVCAFSAHGCVARLVDR